MSKNIQACSLPITSVPKNEGCGLSAAFSPSTCYLLLALRVLHPLHDLRQRGLLAVHENPDAVYARAHPDHAPDRCDQQPDAECDLPPCLLYTSDAADDLTRVAL